MDNSVSDSDISLSPSQLLERLQLLRELQLMQRGKLQKQQLQYEDSPTTSNSITEIVSRFTNSTSYNTFRSLIQGSCEDTHVTPSQVPANDLSPKITEKDLIEGVSVLHVSKESEFIIKSPLCLKRKSLQKNSISSSNEKSISDDSHTKKIDEMPIQKSETDFLSLVEEKIQKEGKPPVNMISAKDKLFLNRDKKPFLKRGQGMARFGIDKKDLVIQSTQALPWKKKTTRNIKTAVKSKPNIRPEKCIDDLEVQIIVPNVCLSKGVNAIKKKKNTSDSLSDNNMKNNEPEPKTQTDIPQFQNTQNVPQSNLNSKFTFRKPEPVKIKHHLVANKSSTWASILTKEQNDFLAQLKQSDYYKNFISPTKSTVSDVSCDDNLYKLRQEREEAEQNMFELLENKISNESFNLENSFFKRFIRRDHMEDSGESTPLVMQRCLAENPNLLRIPTGGTQQDITCETSNCDTCDCCTDCDHETCSSVSTCCSCKTVEETPGRQTQKNTGNKQSKENNSKKEVRHKSDMNTTDKTENDIMKENMAEMNAKLIATSELLKERLKELEDEIETFRKENLNLTKAREELDSERQRFYAEKSNFEQKLNEDKILSEYYIAEERDKLSKQKQMYERYVREIRGRLNKKERDEVVNLKKEIADLKEDIRTKDAKSTSLIARLRNQIKILEKDKKELNDELEKLKKENRRLTHSNDITRRMTNIKYLEQINKKLRDIGNKDAQSEINIDKDAKYKSFEIERQSRSRKRPVVTQTNIRPRAKSVPNLNVTSRYAKYFSQKDSISQSDRNQFNDDRSSISENSVYNDDLLDQDDARSIPDDQVTDEEENNLEKLYLSRFTNNSSDKIDHYKNPKNSRSPIERQNSFGDHEVNNSGDFFLCKPGTVSNRESQDFQTNKSSPTDRYQSSSPNMTTSSRTKSPISVISHRMYKEAQRINEHVFNESNQNRTKSPVSILSHRSSYPDNISTNNKENIQQVPQYNKTDISKTSLTPMEIKKPDGSKEYIFPNGNVKYISADGKYSKFMYYNGDVKENFYDEGKIKYLYAETKTFHTTHPDGHEVIEFADGQIEKRYKDGSSEIRLPNGSVRYHDPKNAHVREEWRFPDGTTLTVSAAGEQRVVFSNGQVEVHAKDHKRREFPDGTVKLIYNDGTSETRYSSGRVRIKDKHGNLIMDSAPG